MHSSHPSKDVLMLHSNYEAHVHSSSVRANLALVKVREGG